MKIAKDKQQHALAGFLIGLLIPAPWGIVAWYTAAIGKEWWDSKGNVNGTEDIKDVYWTCLGGIVGTILNTILLWLVL
jgi:hypothetical protein